VSLNKSIDYYLVHDTGVSVQCLDQKLRSLILINYQSFKVEALDNIDLKIVIGTDLEKESGNKISASVYQKNNKLYYRPLLFHRRASLAVDVIYKENLLSVKANYSEPFYTYLLSLVNREVFQKQMYQRIMRACIHMPLFWLLERKGFGFLHAAAVAKNGQALLFAGDNGSGKSTLALSLLAHDYGLLSDNFLLFKESTAYSFPEVLRLSATSAKLLGREMSGRQVFGKYQINLNKSELAESAQIKRLYYVEPSNKGLFLDITPTDMKVRLDQMHAKLAEFHYSSPMRFLDTLVADPITSTERDKRLSTLLENTSSVLLNYDKPANLNDILSTIQQ
jgi:energy-coupling factor transporter ATP-binding protein EcfA2